MNAMKRALCRTLFVLTAGAWLSPAAAQNGTVHNVFEFTIPSFSGIPCLDIPEPVTFYVTIRQTTHEVVTPSGGYHLIDQWVASALVVGDNTRREWAAVSNGSPLVLNQRVGETFTTLQKLVMMPLTAGAPKITTMFQLHTTVNADGIQTANVLKLSDANWRCIFPGA